MEEEKELGVAPASTSALLPLLVREVLQVWRVEQFAETFLEPLPTHIVNVTNSSVHKNFRRVSSVTVDRSEEHVDCWRGAPSWQLNAK
jgi:hypothetical protein